MRKKVLVIFDLALVTLAVMGIFLSFFAIHDDVQVVRVVSDSMAPAIHRGDSLLFSSRMTSSIEKGQILLLPLADGSGASYVHRVYRKKVNSDDTVEVVTKGDANPVPDAWKFTITSSKVPVYLATLPTKNIPLYAVNRWVILSVLCALLLTLTPFIFPRRVRDTHVDS